MPNSLLAFVKVAVYSTCNATDTWSWTAEGSLQYRNQMCLKPKNGENPNNDEKLVLSSLCNHTQNFFKFVPSKYVCICCQLNRTKDICALCSRTKYNKIYFTILHRYHFILALGWYLFLDAPRRQPNDVARKNQYP